MGSKTGLVGSSDCSGTNALLSRAIAAPIAKASGTQGVARRAGTEDARAHRSRKRLARCRSANIAALVDARARPTTSKSEARPPT